MDGLVALHLPQARNRDRAGRRDAPEIVPQQVDDHDVLGPFLGVGGELFGKGPVLLEPAAARARPLHRPRPQPSLSQGEEELRGSGQNRVRPDVDEGAVTGALGRADIVVESEEVPGDRGAQAGGEVDLVGVAGGDEAVDLLHRGGVRGPLHRRLPGAGGTGACLGGRRQIPGRLPAFGEQAEPEQGQGPGGAGAHRLVDARGRLVGDEPGGVKPPGNRPFDLFKGRGNLAVGVDLDLPA